MWRSMLPHRPLAGGAGARAFGFQVNWKTAERRRAYPGGARGGETLDVLETPWLMVRLRNTHSSTIS